MQELSYSIFRTRLGKILIAATASGIAWLGFGDNDEAAVREFRRDMPDVPVIRDDPAIARYAMPIAAFLEGRAAFPALPLDVTGTEFQRRVWEALCAIPPGATKAYSEIARAIGRRDAMRAVGAAVGANPVSILIPCHRALAKDGSLHNYRYGLARKRALLDLEGARIGSANLPMVY
jgi:AraC family transcriptional regulator, regulatory protein of adaptative response / methylated-DNA-[protein]-cysteine methyltransferase